MARKSNLKLVLECDKFGLPPALEAIARRLTSRVASPTTTMDRTSITEAYQTITTGSSYETAMPSSATCQQ